MGAQGQHLWRREDRDQNQTAPATLHLHWMQTDPPLPWRNETQPRWRTCHGTSVKDNLNWQESTLRQARKLEQGGPKGTVKMKMVRNASSRCRPQIAMRCVCIFVGEGPHFLPFLRLRRRFLLLLLFPADVAKGL